MGALGALLVKLLTANLWFDSKKNRDKLLKACGDGARKLLLAQEEIVDIVERYLVEL